MRSDTVLIAAFLIACSASSPASELRDSSTAGRGDTAGAAGLPDPGAGTGGATVPPAGGVTGIAGLGGAGLGGTGGHYPSFCTLTASVTIAGSGFEEFESMTAFAELRPFQLCAGAKAQERIVDGRFSFTLMPSEGGTLSLFIDEDGNGVYTRAEPEWNKLVVGPETWSSAVTPADFGR